MAPSESLHIAKQGRAPAPPHRDQPPTSISSISGKDLEVTKENDRLVIRFAYDKEIPIVEPVFLLIKFRGESR